MIVYDRTEIEKIIRITKYKTEIFDDESIRLSENLTYVFRMFLVSMTIIVILLSIFAR